MAQRRMFSLQVVDTDKFMDMPLSARLLYYELGMRADDDGFVASVNRIARTVGCSKEDITTLTDNGYLLTFDSGVIVIKHWKMNNYIQGDRYHRTIYTKEFNSLYCENGTYYFEELVDLGF